MNDVSLSKKLNEIKFPCRVPNSPYSIKAATPATPISMMMELKTWLKQNTSRVVMVEGLGISETSYSFINTESEDENRKVALIVADNLEESLKQILNSLLDKEGRKGGD